jgi:hypothetical protein
VELQGAFMKTVIPLAKRPLDIAILCYFIFNVVFVTYNFGLEQVLIQDPREFTYPAWPPAFVVDLLHWWGRHFDPLVLARPAWWRAVNLIDVLFFGPFYAVATYAFIRGKEWIRIPAVVYASAMETVVIVILAEELWGAFASPMPGIVLAANAAWLVFPLLILWRMWRSPHPFSKETPEEQP